MTTNLEILQKYFEAGTAEGDDEFLEEVFVTSQNYLDVISLPRSGPRIVRGKKGSGKSALARYFTKQMDGLGVPTIFLRPHNIKVNYPDDNSLGALITASEEAILRAIAGKLGSDVSGTIIDASQRILLEESKAQGLASDDAVEKMLKVLSPIGKAFTNIDFDAITSIGSVTPGNIKSAVERSISKSGSLFYVSIDDVDQAAAPDVKGQLNRIWALFLAARYINEQCPNIKFVITIREEVWSRITKEGSSQRDQVDHFRNLSKKVTYGADDLKKIILERLKSAKSECSPNSNIAPYEMFFDTAHVRIPTAHEEFRYWDDFVVNRSRERPRDSIQMIYRLCEKAISDKDEKISATHVDKVMPVYSEERVDDLKTECGNELPQIKDVVRSFHEAKWDDGSFKLTLEGTIDFLRSIPSRFQVVLYGKALSASNDEDILDLWRYLYEVGFLNARVSDSREPYGYRHITPEEDSQLVSKSRYSEMQSIIWEVNPAYRDYLIKVQNDKQFNFGRPRSRRSRRSY